MPLARACACSGAAASIACKAATAISDRNWVRIGTPQKIKNRPGTLALGPVAISLSSAERFRFTRKEAYGFGPPCRQNLANGLQTAAAPKVQSKVKNISSLQRRRTHCHFARLRTSL